MNQTRHSHHPWQCILVLLAFLCGSTCAVSASEQPPFVDYCEAIEQEIQGRKHGFLAGNVTYYIGGFHGSN